MGWRFGPQFESGACGHVPNLAESEWLAVKGAVARETNQQMGALGAVARRLLEAQRLGDEKRASHQELAPVARRFRRGHAGMRPQIRDFGGFVEMQRPRAAVVIQ